MIINSVLKNSKDPKKNFQSRLQKIEAQIDSNQCKLHKLQTKIKIIKTLIGGDIQSLETQRVKSENQEPLKMKKREKPKDEWIQFQQLKKADNY